MNASFGGGGSWGGNALAVAGGFGNAGWAKSGATRPEVADYIKATAAKMGIDPQVALRVAQSEGLNTYVGDYGTSFGAFQLHYGGSGIRGMNSGGLGDAFTRATGLNARDPSTWKAQVDFALRQAKQGGWSPWHGAAHVGIGNRQGLDWHGAPTVDGRGASKRTVSPGSPAGTSGTSAGGTTASRLPPVHVALHLDGKVISRHVIADLNSSLRHPTSSGAVDPYSHYVHSGVPLPDVA